MPKTVKKLLTTVETEIFRNWNDMAGSEVKAVNITLCNASASAVDVWLSFCILSGLFSAGMVLSKFSIAANKTETIEITDRIINCDESIRAFCSVNDTVTLSVDLLGVLNDLPTYTPPS